ncbi:Hsp33 family molecular chaperone HslO [Thiomicrorhabdus xiamenensis]|uniref:Hsp33 family molecular chaperone HslO n=1 Tax=Thiomicrorhabdus xiamenensis TaxID=2739063 RepID=A0A7D4SIH0_9GAMM|nr:Hsp33 family molecular chaperone HslO [Thiomicrorhabdus xiamenensis]QKI89680.1 Hsp33 family molecular chaperone HslO [Thiomicrorhabdus xiamenensis]
MAQDVIQRFLFKEHSIRGQVIQLDEAWQKMTHDRHYPEVISQLLGELTAVSVILASGLKHDGKITLQIQGKGPVNLLVVEVTHDFKLRGVAKTSQPIENQKTMDELLGNGQILVTLENNQTNSHFQSYVPREGDTVAKCFETFFQQSEQLPSRLWLAADENQLGGLLLQKMPDTDNKDADAWDRVSHLAETVKDEELMQLPSEELLHRLFHEETVELFEGNTVVYECPQDKSRVDDMLRKLGEEEVREMLEEQGEIVIHNEICNYHIRYDAEDVDALFAKHETLQ